MEQITRTVIEVLRYIMALLMLIVSPVTNLFCQPKCVEPQPFKLGAYYWDGWYEQIPAWTDRLLNEFADREPTWGWLSAGVENMEMQIDLAADNGLGFFAFDWYYPQDGWLSPMNACVDRFLASSNRDRMEFCLLVANHGGGYIYPETWDDATERFLPYLTSDRALQVDGKPVIIFFSIGELETCLGGEKQVKLHLDKLRAACVEAGLEGCYVMGCSFAERTSTGDVKAFPADWTASALRYRAMGFDALTGYNYHRGSLPDGSWEYPFKQLNKDYELAWKSQAKYGLLPYMPVLNGGWDCRPWETSGDDSNRSCYSPDRTPEDFYRHVLKAAEWTKKYPNASAGGLALFYAWNEMGEGGYILPTIGDNGAVLRAIGDAMRVVNGN